MPNYGAKHKPTFCEWFDPNNIDHINAYVHLQKTGIWPNEFIPKNTFVEPGWQWVLAFKLADKWIRHIKNIDDELKGLQEKYGA